MFNPQTEIDHEQRLLEQHRTNLRQLRQQQAAYGAGEVRLNLLHQIEHEQAQIRQGKARLRQLGQTPVPAIGDPPETLVPFARRLLIEYPEPIAQACAQFNQAANAREQFIALDRLLVHLTKYLAALFIGQVRLDHLPAYPLPDSLAWMAYPILESWTEAIVQLSKLYSQGEEHAQCRFSSLLEACTRPLLGKGELIDAIDYFTRQLDKTGIDEPSVIDLLRLFAWYRDREWQDAPGDYESAKLDAVLMRLQPALITLLNELVALRNYPLLYVQWADTVDARVNVRAIRFMGVETDDLTPTHKPPIVLEQDAAYPRKARRFYVGIPKGDSFEFLLPLHPFFVLYQWETYALDKHEESRYIEFRSCSRGTRFRPPVEAKSFHASWSGAEHSPAQSEEIPPLLGEENALPESVGPLHSSQEVDPLPLTWFNAEGRQALEIALGEALRLGHRWLGIEFLLMGLSKQSQGIFPRLLGEMGIDPGTLRGTLRGMSGEIRRDDWREKDVNALGAEALPRLQRMDPARVRQQYATDPEQLLVITPRMMTVLEDAMLMAKEQQTGHRELLMAAFKQQQALPIQLCYRLANEAGWGPKQLYTRLAELAEIPFNELGSPDKSPATPKIPAPRPDDQRAQPTYGRNLTAEAQAGQLHEAVGESARKAMAQIGRILLQREANNPILIGDPGVGKTAVVEGFAWRLAGGGKGAVEQLAGRQVIEISVNSLTAGTKYRGDLENRVQQLLQQVKAADGQVIVFIDEIHTILDGSSTSGVADAFKPALARGEFPCIGATTMAEYRQHIEKDPALARRFTPVWLEEPTPEEAYAILTQVANGHLAEHHGTVFRPEAIKAAVDLAARYILDERLPGKAIKILDQAASGRIIGGSLSGIAGMEEMTAVGPGAVELDDILEVVAERTNIPVSQLGKTDKQRLLDLEAKLKAHIFGQDVAIDQVVRLVKRAGAGLTDPRRPQGVFLLAGPTGVGKTELALALAAALFDREEAICRLDMSEFMEKHQIARLTGAPPGYVGHDEEGQLTGRLRRQPYSIVLLDEMEKAHPNVQHLFLQLFDSGRLTDAQGRLADGRRAIFIMTTNLGAKEAMSFLSAGKSYEEKLLAAIHNHFTPEFINRIDRIICFNPLDESALLAIFDREFGLVQARLQQEKGITLKLPDAVKAQLVQQVAQQQMGARPLRRLIEDQLIAPLVDRLLAEDVAPGSAVTVGLGWSNQRWRLDTD